MASGRCLCGTFEYTVDVKVAFESAESDTNVVGIVIRPGVQWRTAFRAEGLEETCYPEAIVPKR